MENTKRERAQRTKITTGQIVLTTILAIFTFFCFAPVLLTFIVSISSPESILDNGFTFFPSGWSLDGYRYVMTFSDQLIQSYMVTIFITVVATLGELLFTSMFAFPMSRKEFMLRGAVSKFLLVTMLVGGGALGTYLVYSGLYGLRNNILVLMLPGMVNASNIFVMRTFITSNVPDSLIEAARIDGANDAYTFSKIVLPIMVPVLASIGFLTAVGHWNQWYTSMLYIDNPKLTTLQLLLMRVEKNIEFLQQQAETGYMDAGLMQALREIPDLSCRMALLFCVLGPILIVYPFFQKYFISGMTIGAVKG